MKTPSLFLILLLSVMNACTTKTGEEERDAFAYLQNQFAQPGRQYRSAPLWVWNTEVTPAIIDDMLQEFAEKGFGGVFIHPRPGLITEYLSDEWFELCAHALDKCRELDLDLWIYDENSYPSGFAGGHVPVEMPESYNQGQMLHLSKTIVLSDTAGVYLVLLRSGNGFDDISADIGEHLGRKGDYYLFSRQNYHKSPWYGGFSYVDLLVPGVTEKFIEVTMRGYEESLGSEFGRLVPGVFTDEPNIEVQGRGNIRWTPDLFEQFEKMWGYRLEANLPSLFEETGDWRRIRHNYYGCLLNLFIERWSKPWYAYTEAKGLEWTGHYWEHGWPNPNHGPDHMAMYAWHQRPAIDMLFNQFDESSPNAQFGNIRAVKELASAANQLGRKRTLSETYGGGGWELSFADMKRLGDWQYALGINTLNQHLSFMSIAGARKYDYPPSFTAHNPWWPHYRTQNLYFARLSLALSSGQQVNDILVLEPTTSAWMYAAYQTSHPRMREIGQEFQSFVTALEKAQVEYDLGSENIIALHGSVAGNRFVVGRRSYHTVVLPPGTENLDRATFDLLSEYLAQGGALLALGRVTCIDGKTDPRLDDLYASPGITDLSAGLDAAVIDRYFASPELEFPNLETAGGNLYHHRRVLVDGQLLFLANVSLDEATSGNVRIRGERALFLDAESGGIFEYPSIRDGAYLVLNYELPATGSMLFFAGGKSAGSFPRYEAQSREGEMVPLSPLTAERRQANVLSIDFCDLALGGNTLNRQHVYHAADTVYKYHGFPNGNPWNTSVQYKRETVDRDTFPEGTGFRARYWFTVADGVSTSGLLAAVERPGLWQVSLNDQIIEPLPGQWWLDRNMGLFDIGAGVIPGRNYIELQANPMRVHAEIEPVFILGDFALEPAQQGFRIVPSKSLQTGNWIDQGMPLYGHEVAYKTSFTALAGKKYALRLGDWRGTVVTLVVNGREAGHLAYPPFARDISEYMTPGENSVEIIVTGSLKNTLGPHYGKPNPGLVSPWHWRNHRSPLAGAEYDLRPSGLMEAPVVVELK